MPSLKKTLKQQLSNDHNKRHFGHFRQYALRFSVGGNTAFLMIFLDKQSNIRAWQSL
jgi:hypothetical protein